MLDKEFLEVPAFRHTGTIAASLATYGKGFSTAEAACEAFRRVYQGEYDPSVSVHIGVLMGLRKFCWHIDMPHLVGHHYSKLVHFLNQYDRVSICADIYVSYRDGRVRSHDEALEATAVFMLEAYDPLVDPAQRKAFFETLRDPLAKKIACAILESDLDHYLSINPPEFEWNMHSNSYLNWLATSGKY
jgi:hypothetical protein